jgi:(p)ppGpp synthase/HD superfamily hydrolase
MAYYTNDFRDFAISAHGQQLYGDKPYVYHLDQVHDILRSNNYIDEAKISYLHDVVEDTDITLKDIEKRFGQTISNIIDFCTDSPGINRKDRKNQTYIKCIDYIKNYTIGHHLYYWVPWAATIKVADRLANVLHSKNNHPIKYQMYRNEHIIFQKVYHLPRICDSLWTLMNQTFGISINEFEGIDGVEFKSDIFV